MTFHDGEPFNAEAVCYNFERMFDQNEAGQTAGEYWGYVMGAFSNDAENSLYQGCEATGEFEAVVTISGPTSGFPTMLSLESLSMQSPKALEEGDANGIAAEGEGFSFPAYANAPVGTGPFTLRRVRRGQRHDHARAQRRLLGRRGQDERARLPGHPRREHPSPGARGRQHQRLRPAEPGRLGRAGGATATASRSATPFNILYLGLNPEANPQLKDLKVRQALYHALNRDQLVQTQLPEGAAVATQFMPDTVSGYNTEPRALRLRPRRGQATAGRGRRRGHDADVRLPDRGQPARTCRTRRRSTRRCAPTSRPSASRSTSRRRPGTVATSTTSTAGKYDAYILGWTGDYDSPYNFIGTFFGNLEGERLRHRGHPWGKQLADDLKAADAIVDEAERGAAYEKINQQIMEEYLPGLADQPLAAGPRGRRRASRASSPAR